LLATRLRKHLGQLVHVNVIPLNPTQGSKWDASPRPVERELVRLVNAGGVACTVWDMRGQEIAAACGQLAAEG
jgi:23S rRNA (adenine2503-C2)-methyltransferase